MNKLLYAIVCLLSLTSCAEQYNIAGNSSVALFDGRMLYLKVSSCDGTVVQARNVDSCQVVHGRFTFGGDIDSVAWAWLYTGNESVMPVVIENGNLNVSVDNASQRVTGGKLNEKLYKFMQKRDQVTNEMWELEQKCLRMMREGRSPEAIRKEMMAKSEQLDKKMEKLETDFVKNNYDNVLGPGLFMMLCSQYPTPIMTDQIRKIIDKAPPTFMSNPFVSNYVRQARYNRPE